MPRSPKPNSLPNSTDNSHDSLSTHIPSKSSALPSQHNFADQHSLDQDPSTSSPSPQTTHFSRDSEPPTLTEMEEKGLKGKGVSRSSPSASSSQGDMADTEMDVNPSQPSEEQQPQPPPKKKRTRTLTTPQQAAVLHALLAQSRFPTTAMREEVGRSIGLSARKVQNQRQKARRPKGQNAPPLTRPPQYGPYTNVPLGTIGEPSSVPSSSMHQATSSRGELGAISGPSGELRSFNPPLSASSSASADFFTQQQEFLSEGHRRRSSTSQLSGPGVPGSSVSLPGYAADPFPSRLAEYPAHPSSFELVTSRSSTSREPGEPPFTSRPSELHHRRRQSGGEYPITLPPLRLPRSPSPGAQSAPVQSSGAGFPITRGGALSSAPAVLPPPGVPGEQIPPYIPPPFTLEPQPLWDDSAFSPFNRPHPSTYDQVPSPTHYQHPTSTMPPSLHLPSLSNLRLQEGNAESQITLPPIRSRADTVRSASSTHGPTSGPSAPSSYSRSYDRDPSGHHE